MLTWIDTPLSAVSLQNKIIELRATYASLPDELSGRMPLAYVQLVQILTDLLIVSTPLALTSSVGGFGAIVGAVIVTLFHSSIANLASARSLPPRSSPSPCGGCACA